MSLTSCGDVSFLPSGVAWQGFESMPSIWLQAYIRWLRMVDSTLRTEKFFCLNAGGCGSQYLVELLACNHIEGCVHEQPPTLDEEGVQYYLDNRLTAAIIRHLRKPRRNVWLESSNRLFSLAGPIRQLYPHARFIHLHREGRETLSSMASKTVFLDCFQNSSRLRYASRLAGPRTCEPFERACHYWNNYNVRILDDLRDEQFLDLKFVDLVAGRIDHLGEFLGRELPVTRTKAVNTKLNIKKEGWDKFHYENWPGSWKTTFERICGETNRRLGYAPA